MEDRVQVEPCQAYSSCNLPQKGVHLRCYTAAVNCVALLRMPTLSAGSTVVGISEERLDGCFQAKVPESLQILAHNTRFLLNDDLEQASRVTLLEMVSSNGVLSVVDLFVSLRFSHETTLPNQTRYWTHACTRILLHPSDLGMCLFPCQQ